MFNYFKKVLFDLETGFCYLAQAVCWPLRLPSNESAYVPVFFSLALIASLGQRDRLCHLHMPSSGSLSRGGMPHRKEQGSRRLGEGRGYREEEEDKKGEKKGGQGERGKEGGRE